MDDVTKQITLTQSTLSLPQRIHILQNRNLSIEKQTEEDSEYWCYEYMDQEYGFHDDSQRENEEVDSKMSESEKFENVISEVMIMERADLLLRRNILLQENEETETDVSLESGGEFSARAFSRSANSMGNFSTDGNVSKRVKHFNENEAEGSDALRTVGENSKMFVPGDHPIQCLSSEALPNVNTEANTLVKACHGIEDGIMGDEYSEFDCDGDHHWIDEDTGAKMLENIIQRFEDDKNGESCNKNLESDASKANTNNCNQTVSGEFHGDCIGNVARMNPDLVSPEIMDRFNIIRNRNESEASKSVAAPTLDAHQRAAIIYSRSS